MSKIHTGTVSHVVPVKLVDDENGGRVKKGGFGFLTIEGYDKDVFFLGSSVAYDAFKDLKKGDKVNFKNVVETARGYVANGIELISDGEVY